MNLKNIYSYVTGIVRLRGATDNTQIGNSGNRLLVAATLADGSGTSVTLGRKTQASSLPVVQNQEKTFHVLQQGVAIGNNKSMLSVFNASGSAVKLKLREVRLINSQNTAVTGIVADFRMKRFTTLHTAGTDITPEKSDSADTMSSSITVKTNATISGESITDLRRAKFSSDEWGVGAQDVESADHTSQLLGLPWYSPGPEQKPFTLNAGEGIHIKHVVNSTVGSFDILVVFTEEAA